MSNIVDSKSIVSYKTKGKDGVREVALAVGVSDLMWVGKSSQKVPLKHRPRLYFQTVGGQEFSRWPTVPVIYPLHSLNLFAFPHPVLLFITLERPTGGSEN